MNIDEPDEKFTGQNLVTEKKSKAHVWVMKRKNSVYSCLRSCWAAKCRCLSPQQWVEINYVGAFLFSYSLVFCL